MDKDISKIALAVTLEMAYAGMAENSKKDLEKALAEMGIIAKVNFSIDIKDIDLEKFENYEPDTTQRMGDLIFKPSEE